MNSQEFQANHSGDLKAVLDSDMGKRLLTVLSSLRPPHEFPPQEHLLIENRGAVRGYELCLRNMISLTMAPKNVTQPEANYGVPEKPTPPKE